MSHLLINSSIIVFVLGLIAEQIAALRFERGDKLFQAEDARDFSVFKDFEHTVRNSETIN